MKWQLPAASFAHPVGNNKIPEQLRVLRAVLGSMKVEICSRVSGLNQWIFFSAMHSSSDFPIVLISSLPVSSFFFSFSSIVYWQARNVLQSIFKMTQELQVANNALPGLLKQQLDNLIVMRAVPGNLQQATFLLALNAAPPSFKTSKRKQAARAVRVASLKSVLGNPVVFLAKLASLTLVLDWCVKTVQ